MAKLMNAPMKTHAGLVVGALSCACFLGTANAQVMVSIEEMSFKVTGAF